MIPIEFDEQNGVLTKPDGMTDEQCRSLPCFRNGERVISCWQMSWKERLVALVTGKVWVSVWSGHSSPPIVLMIDTPFLSQKLPVKVDLASRGNGGKW